MPARVSDPIEVEIDELKYTIVVHYDVTPGEPEVRWGDCPQPGTGPEISVTDIDIQSVAPWIDGEYVDLAAPTDDGVLRRLRELLEDRRAEEIEDACREQEASNATRDE